MGTGDDDQTRITGLEQQMEDVTRRLAALERAASPFPMTMPGPRGMPGPQEAPADGQEDEPVVAYSGKGQFGPHRIGIGQRKTLSQVRSVAPENIAPVFTGLASPARIGLLYALLDGPRSGQELREALDGPSAGQLYHHLRELIAAGLIVQPARGVYQIPPGKIVAVCVAVTAAAHLASASHQAPQPPLPDEPHESAE